MAYESEASLTTLIRGVLDDTRELFREEVALARAEVREEMSRAAAAAVRLGMAAAALLFGATFLLTAVALGIAALFGWPAWAGFGLVGVLLAVAGAVALMSARRAAPRLRDPLPRTMTTIKENFQ